jgi:hypothetical protein
MKSIQAELFFGSCWQISADISRYQQISADISRNMIAYVAEISRNQCLTLFGTCIQLCSVSLTLGFVALLPSDVPGTAFACVVQEDGDALRDVCGSWGEQRGSGREDGGGGTLWSRSRAGTTAWGEGGGGEGGDTSLGNPALDARGSTDCWGGSSARLRDWDAARAVIFS